MGKKQMNKLNMPPVFPIPPAYDKNGNLDLNSVRKYIKYLEKNGVEVIMTTAGTSQFNLLSISDIISLNKVCAEFKGKSILGVPALSETEAIDFIVEMNILGLNNSSLMLLYPDRYYDDESILGYFNNLADLSMYPCFIHGMFMRKGTGGTYNFTAELINKISLHENIIGMKEETNDVGLAYNVCKDINKDNFIVIVAGGSMKRFLSLHSTGVQTFLTGIGNILPKIDIDFHTRLTNGDLYEAYYMVNEFENLFFDVFMKYGWHLSLREGLYLENHYEPNTKLPFPRGTKEMINDIKNIIEEMKLKLNDYE